MYWRWRGWWIVLGLLLWMPSTAQAHGIFLLRCSPAANARLTAAPAEVRLWFSSPVKPEGSTLNLISGDETVLNLPAGEVDATDPILLKLTPGVLPAGVYIASWRVISAEDGHAARGSYSFSIGPGETNTGDSCDSTETVAPLIATVRGGLVVGLALLLSGAALWPPPGQARRGLWVGWLMIGVAGGFNVFLINPQASTGPLIMLFWLQSGAALKLARQNSQFRWFVLGLGCVLLALLSLEGGSGTRSTFADLAVGWLHGLSAALLVGSLIHGFIFRVTIDRSQLLLLGPGALLPLLLTGAYLIWLEVGSLAAMTSTLYGSVLLAKLGLLVAAIGLGILFGWRGWGRWPLLSGLTGVLALSAVLSTANPARELYVLQAAVPTAPEPVVFFDVVLAAGFQIQLEVDPGLVGENKLYVVLFDPATGSRIDQITVSLSLAPVEAPTSTQDLALSGQGDGVYGANTVFDNPGTWLVRATLGSANETAVTADFSVPIALPPAPEPSFVEVGIAQSERQPMLLIIGSLLLLVAGYGLSRRWQLLLSSSAGIVGLVLLLSAVLV